MNVTEPARRTAPTLTGRQIEVLAQLQRGRTVREIAAELGVSDVAVYRTLGRIRRTGIELSEVGR